MIKKIWHLILKFFYYKLILEIIVIRKDEIHFHNLMTFHSINVKTSHGDFTVSFKKDRRKKDTSERVKSYIVELKVPEKSNAHLKDMEKYVILVLKFNLIAINYEVLSEVLLDKCLDKYIQLAGTVMKNK